MGKQIRIYLATGGATGIRHAEITNWTGQAIACPRSHFQDLRSWEEVKRPGVYLLFGTNEESGEDAVYIGESEVVVDRLHSHISGKEFWTELVAFTSKDDNLTKAHVKYLESRLIQLSIEAGRYRVTNSAAPVLPALPRADKDAMEDYLVSTQTLLGVLGHRVLEPYLMRVRSRGAPSTSTIAVESPASTTLTRDEGTNQQLAEIFELRIGGLTARATRTNEGLVVLAGSDVAMNPQPSLSIGYRALREKLTESGSLEASGAKLRVVKDVLFKSPSQAAAVVVGYSINGRDAWRTPDGTTYAAYEQRVSDALLAEIAAPVA